MSDTWKQWEGQIVDGKFPLLRYLSDSDHGAVFLTERTVGEHLSEAAIKIIPAGSENVELELSRWQRAAELSHPQLISLYEMGRFEVDGRPIAYVVMEYAEENLAGVLSDRALTAAETRTMLEAVLNVLGYVHGKGFVHGQIQPANIMAIGDQLKLSSDSLRRVGESLDGIVPQTAYDPPEYAAGLVPVSQTISPAGDVWSLGMTAVETLTQRLPAARTAEQLDPLIPQSLQEPFLEVASHCLLRRPEARWTIAQIAARLEGKAPVSRARDLPIQVHAPARAPQRSSGPSRPSARLYGYAAPIAIGFALLLAAILAGPRLLRHRTEAPQAPVAEGERAAVPPASSQIAPPPEKHATARKKSSAEDERRAEAPTPTPAVAHPETTREEETSAMAGLAESGPIRGEVAHRALPDVLQSARNSIRGTVRVKVKVDVDRSGDVEDAELESSGPSKYFARAALGAARLWKFNPPRVGGQGVLSSWTLQFEFTRDETRILPTQEMP